MENIGRKMAEWRKKARLSQIEAAAIMTTDGYSITNKVLSSWEKGKSNPNPEQFLNLCRIYGITDIYWVLIPIILWADLMKKAVQRFWNILTC